MSKPVVSLPGGTVGRSLIGGGLAMLCYLLLQTLCALLLHKEIIGEAQLYPVVCVSAALASFVGCGYSVLKGRGGGMLTVSAVAAVFLILTVLVGLVSAGGSLRVRDGMVGIGLSMAVGGLLSALAGDALLARSTAKRRRKRRGGK